MMIPIPIHKLIDTGYITGDDSNCTVILYDKNENGTIVISNADFEMKMYEYYDFYFLMPENSDIAAYFARIFSAYKNAHYSDWNRLWLAWMGEYDPLNNYDRYEHAENSREYNNNADAESSSQFKNISTQQYNNSTNNAADANNPPTVKNFTTTFDDKSNGRLENYSISDGANISTVSGTITATNSGDASDNILKSNSKNNGNEKNTTNIRAYGNIGVTSSQQMIMQEFEMRRNSIANMIFDGFINQYLFYAPF